MHMGMVLSLEPMLELRLEQRQELRQVQELDLTLEMSQTLEDPFETAQRLYEEAKKVAIPVKIGDYTIVVRAALVSDEDLDVLFEGERFAGIISRLGEKYQFLNKDVNVPGEITHAAPKIMAFHCLAAIKVDSFGDDTGTLRQYQAIALEMAYARTLLRPTRYRVYEGWRPEVERTGFFGRDDWQDIVARTRDRFRDITEDIHSNAHKAQCPVLMSGETLRLTDKGAVNRKGEMIPVHRKVRYRKARV